MATNETIPITVPIEQGLTDVASSAPASVTPGEYPKLSDSGPSVTESLENQASPASQPNPLDEPTPTVHEAENVPSPSTAGEDSQATDPPATVLLASSSAWSSGSVSMPPPSTIPIPKGLLRRNRDSSARASASSATILSMLPPNSLPEPKGEYPVHSPSNLASPSASGSPMPPPAFVPNRNPSFQGPTSIPSFTRPVGSRPGSYPPEFKECCSAPDVVEDCRHQWPSPDNVPTISEAKQEAFNFVFSYSDLIPYYQAKAMRSRLLSEATRAHAFATTAYLRVLAKGRAATEADWLEVQQFRFLTMKYLMSMPRPDRQSFWRNMGHPSARMLLGFELYPAETYIPRPDGAKAAGLIDGEPTEFESWRIANVDPEIERRLAAERARDDRDKKGNKIEAVTEENIPDIEEPVAATPAIPPAQSTSSLLPRSSGADLRKKRRASDISDIDNGPHIESVSAGSPADELPRLVGDWPFLAQVYGIEVDPNEDAREITKGLREVISKSPAAMAAFRRRRLAVQIATKRKRVDDSECLESSGEPQAKKTRINNEKKATEQKSSCVLM